MPRGPQGWVLTEQIAHDVRAGMEALMAAGAEVVAQIAAPGSGWGAAATVLAVPAQRLRRGSRLLEECFGPVALVAEYTDEVELAAVLAELQGALAGAS